MFFKVIFLWDRLFAPDNTTICSMFFLVFEEISLLYFDDVIIVSFGCPISVDLVSVIYVYINLLYIETCIGKN